MATVPRCFRQLTTSALLYRTLRSKSAIQVGVDVQQTCGNIHGISALNTKRFSASTTASKNWKPSLENDDDNDDFRFSKGKPAKKYHSKFSSAQKGSTSVTRPSRYQFNEFVDGDDDVNGFWMKRSRGSLTTRQKLEWYTKQIHKLISENKVDQAQELYDSMKTKKIKPSVEVFNALIVGYGRIGKIQKAFNHYNNIKKMGIHPSKRTYTSLFNICSIMTSKTAALSHLLKLWEEFQNNLESKIVKPDIITYNAALKAAASCQNFTLAMEMYSNLCSTGIQPESRTYSSLLSACEWGSNSDNAQWILKEMKTHNINPDIYVFNAVLKASRNNKRGGSEDNEELSDTEIPGEYTMLDVFPDASTEYKSSGIFTGVDDFLQMMAANDVLPDIRTFHLLLQVSEPDKSQEDYVLQVMKEWDFKPDLAILNALVKRRAFWGDVTMAQEYIRVFKEEYGVVADQNIYHSLAKGCRKMAEGMWLLKEMRAQGYSPGVTVYFKLIKNAIHHNAFQYLTVLLKEMRKDSVKPTEEILKLLNEASRPPFEKDPRNVNLNRRDVKKRDYFRKQQHGFFGFYKEWKHDMDLKEAERVCQDTPDEDNSNDFEHL